MTMTTDVPSSPRPLFWYALPHGYRQMDLHPTLEGLDQVARQIRALPEPLRDRADQVFRLYAVVMTMLQKHQVQGLALGLHPDDNDSLALSVLTVSSVPMPGVNPTLVLAKLLAGTVGTTPEEGIHPVELRAGTGFLFETVRKTPAPGLPPEGEAGPREGTVWQGTVAIPDAAGSSVITVQLVTASVELADDYRSVLLGTARTVAFTDPAAPPGGGSGSITTEDTRSAFG